MQLSLQALVLPGIAFLLVFAYIPMAGIVVSFQDYDLIRGFLHSRWVGLRQFVEIFSDQRFWQALRNTITLSSMSLVLYFPFPILLALIFSELPFNGYKRFVQTSSYLPYFISFAVVATMWQLFLDPQGFVNQILLALGLTRQPISFWAEPSYYRPLVVGIGIWQGAGFSAIIYLSALSGVDAEVMEAAIIDGAGRLRRIRHVSLPAISGTIIVLLVLSISGIFRTSVEQAILFGNSFNYSVSYVVEYYSLQAGLGSFRYSFSTALTLTQSVISFLLLLLVNNLAGRILGRRIF